MSNEVTNPPSSDASPKASVSMPGDPKPEAVPNVAPATDATSPEEITNHPSGGVVDPADEPMRNHVIAQIQTCYDPEIPVNIYELGLIYRVDVKEEGKVEVDMTLTSPNCPAAQSLPAEVETKIRAVAGVADVKLEIVWEPTWGPERMSEASKLQLGFPS